MNIIDLIIFLVIAWQGIWGFFKGTKIAMIGLMGVFLSFGVTAKVHSYIASGVRPVMSEFLYPELEERRIDMGVDTTLLDELEISTEVIDYWFMKEDYKEVIGLEVLDTSLQGAVYDSDLFLFLLANLISFLAFFWILNFFSSTIVDMVFRRDSSSKGLTANSYPGLIIGIAQGLAVCALYVFILVLLSSIQFPYIFAAELYNSKLAVIMIEIISKVWFIFATGG